MSNISTKHSIGKMSIINDYIAYSKYSKSKLKPFFKISFFCNVNFRISYFLYKIKLVPFARFFWLLNRIFFAVDIDPRATLKGGFIILHGAGVVIGRYVIAEGSFRIYQGATLGGNNGKESLYGKILISQPVLKDDVIIGINACVLGPVILNEGVRVGANAVVTKSVPHNNATVISSNIIIFEKK